MGRLSNILSFPFPFGAKLCLIFENLSINFKQFNYTIQIYIAERKQLNNALKS